jgi:hypothetical protein
MRFIYSLIPLCALSFLGANIDDNTMAFAIGQARPAQYDNGGSKDHYNAKQEIQMLKDRLDNLGKTHNPTNGWLYMDYLYWKGHGTEWIYGLRVGGETNNEVSALIRGKPEWSSGARLELGFSNVYDWTIAGVATYYQNRTTHKITNAFPIEVVRQFESISEVSTKSKVRYAIADLEIASVYDFNKTFSVKPIFGGRGAWIKNRHNFDAIGHISEQSVLLSAEQDIKPTHRFYGGGPRLGLRANALFGNSGCDLFGLFSTSLLYGTVKSKLTVYEQTGEEIKLVNISDHYKDLKVTIQLQAGLEWKYFFDCNKKAIGLRAAWESNYWWDLKDSITFLSLGMGGTDNPDNSIAANNSFEAFVTHGFNFGLTLDY